MQQIDIAAKNLDNLCVSVRCMSARAQTIRLFWCSLCTRELDVCVCVCIVVRIGLLFFFNSSKKYDGVDFAFPQDGRQCEKQIYGNLS